jgi:hypothetical protein
MMPAVTNTEAANQEKKLSSRVSMVRCLTGLLRGEAGNKGPVHQHSAAASVSSPRVGSTLDERGLWEAVGHPADQRRCGCMDTTSREKLEKSPEQENYMAWPGIILGSSQWQGCMYDGAGIYGGGVSLHGT